MKYSNLFVFIAIFSIPLMEVIVMKHIKSYMSGYLTGVGLTLSAALMLIGYLGIKKHKTIENKEEE